MDPRRANTRSLGGNQPRIDELEYFFEAVGRQLFGPEGEDFRWLEQLLPRTRNLSVLYDLHRSGSLARDPAEDLRFLLAELEGQAPEERDTVFRYRRYRELRAGPQQLLEEIRAEDRLAVVGDLDGAPDGLRPLLARVNAFAWLGVIGLPHLRAELDGDRAILVLDADEALANRGLELLVPAGTAPGLFGAAHGELRADYRTQLVRLAATTRPLDG